MSRISKERLMYLIDLVDEVNEKVNAAVSLEHGKFQDDLYISLFYTVPREMRRFATGIAGASYSTTAYDDGLIKGEAFLKMLLREAECYEPMRRKR